MDDNYVCPELNLEAFNCPHCSAYARQVWGHLTYDNGPGYSRISHDTKIAFCDRCHKPSLWAYGIMVHPTNSIAPFPNNDMPDDVKTIYEEARSILNYSPRAAAALLRLALDQLMIHLDAKGDNLNKKIAYLVNQGLPDRISKAFDGIRTIGNDAVHSGEIDLKEQPEIAVMLFKLLNIIVEKTITEKREIDALFERIPDNKKNGILNRDKKPAE